MADNCEVTLTQEELNELMSHAEGTIFSYESAAAELEAWVAQAEAKRDMEELAIEFDLYRHWKP